MKLAALAFALSALAACNGSSRSSNRISVGAAASVRDVMPELARAFEAETGTRVELTYGSSDTLAAKVEAGAAMDALVLADDSVLAPSRIKSRHIVAVNPIVLVGHRDAGVDFAHLSSLPDGAKLAIGDPRTVPVGRYARAYLQELGAWDALQPRLVLGGDSAGVLALAQSGAAKVAIVYKSDVAQTSSLVILDAPPQAPVANIAVDVLAPRADAFATFLAGPKATAILSAHGLSAEAVAAPPAHKPPDEMDEKMRHCPVSIEGATSEVTDLDKGVRFTIHVPAAKLDDVRQRAHHIVDFAAKKTRAGHGGFDGQGGGHMKNCPVVTDDVVITATDIDGGAQLDVTTATGKVDELRRVTRERVANFPFAGATITARP